MRISFAYLCLDCLFGRSHSCSCSCQSDKQSELLSPRDLKFPLKKRDLFFFKARFATLIQNRYNFKSNGICYWCEDKEGGWADGRKTHGCCRDAQVLLL